MITADPVNEDEINSTISDAWGVGFTEGENYVRKIKYAINAADALKLDWELSTAEEDDGTRIYRAQITFPSDQQRNPIEVFGSTPATALSVAIYESIKYKE